MLSSLLKKQKIEIDAAGLMLDKSEFSWDKILEMYITRRPGRSEYYQLVLLLESEEIIMYPIDAYESLFSKIHIKLSTYIEYFRNRYMMDSKV